MSAWPGKPSGNVALAGMSHGRNHDQMRPATLIGSPRKNAVCSLRESRCHTTSSTTNSTTWKTRSRLTSCISGRLLQLLRVALEDLLAQHAPDPRMQLHEPRLREEVLK